MDGGSQQILPLPSTPHNWPTPKSAQTQPLPNPEKPEPLQLAKILTATC
jgi:hypothetical protein